MASQVLELKVKGLYTSPNDLGSVPVGALSIAENVVIDRDSIVESRRGQVQYGTEIAESNKLFNYKTNLIVSYEDKMAYDSDGAGTWIDYSGTYEPPSTGFKIRSLEAQGNFYFTTSEGIKKIDSLTATPRESGAPPGLGGMGSLTGSGGFLVENTAVAYRMLWGYKDANNNLILGAPSQRLVVTNPSGSGADYDVILTFPIPDGITTEYFYQIYRSRASATASDEPDDELQLVIEGNPTSGEITARAFSTTDVTPYSLMGAFLYTSPSQEGIAQSNYQPPYAVDMDVFKTCAFYANTRQKQSLSLTLISVDLPGLGYEAFSGTVTGSGNTMTIADTSNLRVGMGWVSGGVTRVISIINNSTDLTFTGTPASLGAVLGEWGDRVTIGNVAFYARSTKAGDNTFAVETGGSPEFNIEQTAINLINSINVYPYTGGNIPIYGYYTSSPEDLPGKMTFTEREFGGAAFSATSTIGGSFFPTLPSTGADVESNNEEKQNRVYISKANQPEAVPLLSFLNIGSANFPILRVVALRDGIFFFKPDGIFRISGEVGAFNVSLVDSTVTLKAAESAVAFNNQVFCFTTQGVCAVTDSGVQIMSVPIEKTLLEISSDQYTNFSSATFGVAYESSRQYMLWTVTQEEDTFATQAFVFNSLTNTWTNWIANRTCGIVNPGVNKLFMGKADSGQIMIERKSYTNADYADEEYEIDIDSIVSRELITVLDASDIEVGMAIGVYPNVTEVVAIDGLNIEVLDSSVLAVGPSFVYTPIMNRIQWVPIEADNPGVLKQFSEVTFFFRNAAFREISAIFYSNVSSSRDTAVLAAQLGDGWGSFAWGDLPWGGVAVGQIALRTYIPRDKQRCSWLYLGLETNEAFTGFSLSGVSLMFNVMSSRFR